MTKFIQDFHDIIVTVEFRKILSVYQSVVNVKEDTITKITTDLSKLGLIDSSNMVRS